VPGVGMVGANCMHKDIIVGAVDCELTGIDYRREGISVLLEMPSLMDAIGIALIAIGLALVCLILARRSSSPEEPDENQTSRLCLPIDVRFSPPSIADQSGQAPIA
jgi:hypothetical protein